MDSMTDSSTTLLNAHIGFLDTHLALIHIPLHAYSFFIQPILQLVLHNDQKGPDGEPTTPAKPWMYWQPFVNVSITTTECSIVCPRKQARELFEPVLAGLNPTLQKEVSISKDDYSVIMIGGEGLEAGQRVLDLTSPLAMAGMSVCLHPFPPGGTNVDVASSIFFITSYWSDFILVPLKARWSVIHALEERGFVFEAEAEGEAGHMTNPASPLLQHCRHRNGSSPSAFDFPSVPGTPPPASISELQERTFKLLKQRNVSPVVDENVELVTCAGIKESTASSSSANFTEGKFQHGLTRCFTSLDRPSFFSLTLTDTESASLTLERRLLAYFPKDGEDILLGKDGPEQRSITLDLKDLPLESTGIVCGVASRLIDGMKGRIGSELFNMSYLSTAKAGHVIVYDDEVEDAMMALRGAVQNGVHAS